MGIWLGIVIKCQVKSTVDQFVIYYTNAAIFAAGYACYILSRMIIFPSHILSWYLWISSDSCLVNRCRNGGTCVSDYQRGSYTCICPSEYHGYTCAIGNNNDNNNNFYPFINNNGSNNNYYNNCNNYNNINNKRITSVKS